LGLELDTAAVEKAKVKPKGKKKSSLLDVVTKFTGYKERETAYKELLETDKFQVYQVLSPLP